MRQPEKAEKIEPAEAARARAAAFGMAARACRLRRGGRYRRLNLLEEASLQRSIALLELIRTTRRAKTLLENAVLGSRLALETRLCSSVLDGYNSKLRVETPTLFFLREPCS